MALFVTLHPVVCVAPAREVRPVSVYTSSSVNRSGGFCCEAARSTLVEEEEEDRPDASLHHTSAGKECLRGEKGVAPRALLELCGKHRACACVCCGWSWLVHTLTRREDSNEEEKLSYRK